MLDEMILLIASIALDEYLEEMEENLFVMVKSIIDEDIEKVVYNIAKDIKNDIEDDKEFVQLLDELYNNNYIDFLSIYMLVNGNVDIPYEVKEFFNLSKSIGESSVEKYIKSILIDKGYYY